MKKMHSYSIGACLVIATMLPAMVPTSAVAIPLYDSDNPQVRAFALEAEAKKLLDEDQLQAALEKFEAALPIYQAAGSRSRSAECLLSIGFVKEKLQDYWGAINAFTESLEIWSEIDNSSREIIAANNIGYAYYKLREYQPALKFYRQALTVVEKSKIDQLLSSPLLQMLPGIFADFDLRLRSFKGITVTLMGRVYNAQVKYQQALESYQEALQVSQNLGDRLGEALSLNNIGLWHNYRHQYEQALKSYQQALPIFQELKDRDGVATIYNNIGLAYSNQYQFERALDKYLEALEIQTEIGDNSGIATTRSNMGAVYVQRGEYQRGKHEFQEALTIYSKLKDSEGRAITLNNIGSASGKMGQYQEAGEYYQQALTISKDIDNLNITSSTLNNLGELYIAIAQYEDARKTFEESLNLAAKIEDPVLQGRTLNNLGLAHIYLGQYPQAQEQLDAALKVQEKDEQGKAATLANIALLYQNQGKFQPALQKYQQAQSINKNIGDRGGEGRILTNIAAVHQNLGDYDLALKFFGDALVIQKEIGDLQAAGTTFNSIGVAYGYKGEYEKALPELLFAHSLLQTIGNPREAAATLTNIAELYLMEGLKIQKEIGDLQGAGTTTLTNIGEVDLMQKKEDMQKKYDLALASYQRALKIQREIGDSLRQGETLNNMGKVYFITGPYARGREYFQQGLKIFEDLGAASGKGRALTNLGGLSELNGNVAEAIGFYQQAIESIESMQAQLSIGELKATFASGQIDVYQRLIELLWDEGRFAEAFNYIERSKARALLDGLASGYIDFWDGAADAPIARERKLRAEISDKRQQLIALKALPIQQQDLEKQFLVKNKLEALQADYQYALLQLQLQSPKHAEYADIITGEVASIEEIQKKLDADSTLVEYFVAEKRILAFIITKKRWQTVSVEVSRQELIKSINRVKESELDDPKPENAHTMNLQKLHQWLMAPIKPYLTTSEITIVPHKHLHHVPFAALTDGQEYVNYNLSTLPSASALRYLSSKQKPDNGIILAIGDPVTDSGGAVLTFAKKEARNIAELYNSEALVESEATETAVKLQAGQAGILHIAAHGEYNNKNPLFSTLYLAKDGNAKVENDGLLEVHEIYGLDLSATNLVVLSACETQEGEVSAGDEIVALNRAFIYAGTPSIISTLWTVDDKSTGLLMQQFYTYLQQGMGKAEALRKAQIYLRDQYRQYSHPYYWAAFVLTGDGGAIGSQ